MNNIHFRKSNRIGFDLFIFDLIGEMNRVKVAITFFYKSNLNSLYKVEFYSSLLGIVSWFTDKNTYEGKIWEGEEIAQSLSNLNYHYTGEFLFASEEGEIIKKIINKVLNDLNKLPFQDILIEKMNNPLIQSLQKDYFLNFVLDL
jgi:hypothetical protein